ncbi:MAG: enoyl-CoA hydratase/isomerase family protein [Actinomycetota bacterium]|nr:enoyl-CoA hydratase/isomerase family protein [Actinomycetota bacterium]
MADGRVGYERRGATAVITFDRPEARNAMTWTMYDQLYEACERLDGDDARVAVLRGAGGRAFVAGTDIRQFADFSGGDDGLAYERRMDGIIARLESARVPTVAVVEGYAVGGGLAIAAVCDLRVCTPDARFGIPIARTLGNCVSMATCARLVAVLGLARVKRLLLLADFLDAEEARAAGFVSEVVAPGELDERVDGLCERLADNSPVSMRVTKEALHRLTLDGLAAGDDLVRECYGSRDFHEGVAAFSDKRRPVWRGR